MTEDTRTKRAGTSRNRTSQKPASEPRAKSAGQAPGRTAGRSASKITASGPVPLDAVRGTPDPDFWELRLYIAGQTPKSLTAIANLKRICEENLAGQYRIEVIDLLQHPQLARGDQILAIPTLVRKLPEPVRKIIGDLSNTDRTLVGLDLKPRNAA